MMKRSSYILLALVVSAWIHAPAQTSGPVVERKDDPLARSRFELEKLHDPATGKIPSGIRQRELQFAKSIPLKESLRSPGRLTKGRSDVVQSLAWSRRGPVNVGGRTRALAIDVTNENIIMAGGVSGGLWRSTDGGASWIKGTGVSDLQSITCIAQDTR